MEIFCFVIDVIAVVIAIYALLDVRHLFRKLDERDKATEDRVRIAFIRELQTTTMSMATFYRACQCIDFHLLDPDRDTCFAMLMTFRTYELLNPNAALREKEDWRKQTREQMERGAKEYAELLIKSNLGKLKEGFSIP